MFVSSLDKNEIKAMRIDRFGAELVLDAVAVPQEQSPVVAGRGAGRRLLELRRPPWGVLIGGEPHELVRGAV